MDKEEVARVIEKFTEIEAKKKVLAEKVVSRLEPTPEEDQHKKLMRKFGIRDKEAEEKLSFNFGRYISALVGK